MNRDIYSYSMYILLQSTQRIHISARNIWCHQAEGWSVSMASEVSTHSLIGHICGLQWWLPTYLRWGPIMSWKALIWPGLHPCRLQCKPYNTGHHWTGQTKYDLNNKVSGQSVLDRLGQGLPQWTVINSMLTDLFLNLDKYLCPKMQNRKKKKWKHP